MAVEVETRAASDAQAESILSAFHIPLGGLVSGAATRGQFLVSPSGPLIDTFNPTTGKVLARVQSASLADYEEVSRGAREAFERWRLVPAPKRGEIVRLLG